MAVTSEAGVYHISLTMHLDAPMQQVWDVLTDFRHIYRLNPSIIESRLLPTPEGRAARVFTRMQGCVGFYCREFSRVEDVWETPPGEIATRIVPEMSDFDAGASHWRVEDIGEGTELSYEASLDPGFFVPPVVGGYFVKHKFQEETLLSFEKIECIARVKLAIKRASSVDKYVQMPSEDGC